MLLHTSRPRLIRCERSVIYRKLVVANLMRTDELEQDVTVSRTGVGGTARTRVHKVSKSLTQITIIGASWFHTDDQYIFGATTQFIGDGDLAPGICVCVCVCVCGV
jgi:hypothetical protein